MKTLNHKLLKTANWILACILAMLGFTGCHDEEMDDLVAMYGTPHANFMINGKVVNKENMPISDIEIKCLVEHHGNSKSWFDTIPAVSTNSAGTFTCQFEEIPTSRLRIIATDIDGALNGSYEKDSTDIAISNSDYKGDKGGWFEGSVEKEVNFILKEEIKNE
ncbi:MAG: radical SAM-associated putative lipoprotein [Parabacteroides sp.]|nr:radical SAM-associated putative lipoprotein [Parabacteroides sp.]